jgi:ABC-type polysaccharide/polyol phosphate transport system ATPase subunit
MQKKLRLEIREDQNVHHLFLLIFFLNRAANRLNIKVKLFSFKQSAKDKYIEQEPANLSIGISIKGMTRKFKEKTVVNNLTLNFYEGQITALLGHNGAGKSTTM